MALAQFTAATATVQNVTTIVKDDTSQKKILLDEIDSEKEFFSNMDDCKLEIDEIKYKDNFKD